MTVAVSVEAEVERAGAHKYLFVLMIDPLKRGGFLPGCGSGAMAQGFGWRTAVAIVAIVHLLVIAAPFDLRFC